MAMSPVGRMQDVKLIEQHYQVPRRRPGGQKKEGENKEKGSIVPFLA